MQALEKERQSGKFSSIFNIVERLNTGVVNKRMLESLVRVGAFDKLHNNRKQLFDHIEMILKYGATTAQEKNSAQISLFASSGNKTRTIPDLKPVEDWSQSQKLQEEFGAMGLYLTSHPLLAYEGFIKRLHVVQAGEFSERLSEGYSQIKLAAVVISKRMRSSPKGKFATINMSDPTGIFELSIYDEDLLNDSMDTLETGNILLISADARKDEGGVRMIATGVELLEEVITKYHIAYTIHVHSLETIEQLQRYLPRLAHIDKNTHIHFHVPVKGHGVVITLPQHYTLGLEMIMSIKAHEGVFKIEEVEVKH
jgi:DNA polymerase-3 subunit alpha